MFHCSAIFILGCAQAALSQTKAEISAERKERRAKAQAHKKKLAKKKNNLWDILLRYQDFGVGKTLRRSIWPPEHQTFWTITRVTMRKMVPSARAPLHPLTCAGACQG